jgi:hypothetical protein
VDLSLNDWITNSSDRGLLLSKAWDAAQAAGIALSNFYGYVVVFNGAIGGPTGVTWTPSGKPAVLTDYRWVQYNGTTANGHEMGHAYGLNHSRRDGSPDDYQDPWDIMSAENDYFFGTDPEFGLRGPALNAANMRAQQWLDQSRVFHAAGPQSRVELRPLHRRDLPGYLAAELPNGLIAEFRVKDGWDAAIPRSAVFVHRFDSGNSYIMAGDAGNFDLVAGDSFSQLLTPWGSRLSLTASSIDEDTQTATIGVEVVWLPFPHYDIYQQVLGLIPVDGGGIVITWSGGMPHITKVPGNNPMARVLEPMVRFLSAEQLATPRTRAGLQLEALHGLAASVEAATADLERPCVLPGEPHVPARD